jgi:gliding motility-associated lipoprotein GldD
MPFRVFLSAAITVLAFTACNSDYVPRPRGYFKIPLPQHSYQVFDQPGYPYTFEYPVYASVVKDSTFFETKPENDFWINIDFPQFSGKIYVSYKRIGEQSFDKLKDDSYKMTYKHTYKATSIEDSMMQTPRGVTGIFFNVGGNAATARQFFLSDSTKHFLRGALYFDATPNEDSLSVVNTFLEQDMRHLINSFRWKN